MPDEKYVSENVSEYKGILPFLAIPLEWVAKALRGLAKIFSCPKILPPPKGNSEEALKRAEEARCNADEARKNADDARKLEEQWRNEEKIAKAGADAVAGTPEESEALRRARMAEINAELAKTSAETFEDSVRHWEAEEKKALAEAAAAREIEEKEEMGELILAPPTETEKQAEEARKKADAYRLKAVLYRGLAEAWARQREDELYEAAKSRTAQERDVWLKAAEVAGEWVEIMEKSAAKCDEWVEKWEEVAEREEERAEEEAERAEERAEEERKRAEEERERAEERAKMSAEERAEARAEEEEIAKESEKKYKERIAEIHPNVLQVTSILIKDHKGHSIDRMGRIIADRAFTVDTIVKNPYTEDTDAVVFLALGGRKIEGSDQFVHIYSGRAVTTAGTAGFNRWITSIPKQGLYELCVVARPMQYGMMPGKGCRTIDVRPVPEPE